MRRKVSRQLDSDLRGADEFSILLGQVAAEGQHVFGKALIGEHLVHKAHGAGFLGIHRHIGGDEQPRPVGADQTHQPADAIGGRQHAKLCLGEGVRGAFGRQPEVAGERHFEASADTPGMVGHHERLLDSLHLVPHAAHGQPAMGFTHLRAGVGKAAACPAPFAKVGAGGKIPAVRLDQHDAQLWRVAKTPHRLFKKAHQL